MPGLTDEIAELKTFAVAGNLPTAAGAPLGTANIRTTPEDFVVTEEAGLDFAGQGEFLYLRVRKKGQNTRWVARRLAELMHLPYKAVSYAGLKDRNAVTEQWFSLQLPGRNPELPDIPADEGFSILESHRHNRKLRQGQLSFNRFRLRLRQLTCADAKLVEKRISVLQLQGVPNYFGPQRFGRGLANLEQASDPEALDRLPRGQRGFVISALRSALFNGYLATRVSNGTWRDGLPGEQLISDRARGVAADDLSVFAPLQGPAGVLWGLGYRANAGPAADAEAAYMSRFPEVRRMLEKAGAKFSRRVLCARVAELQLLSQADCLEVGFALGPGSYATMVLKEVFELVDVSAAV